MGVSGQHHAPAALYPRGKDPRYRYRYRRVALPFSFTNPYCFATQKTNIDVFTAVRTEIVRYVTYEAVDWTKLASYMG
jgi:hypothetical protein